MTNAQVIICFGSPGECWNCGGSTTALDPITGKPGPCVADERFCSTACFEDYLSRSEQFDRDSAWCPLCGFDLGEHATYCLNRAET